jgi:hypothetical protein
LIPPARDVEIQTRHRRERECSTKQVTEVISEEEMNPERRRKDQDADRLQHLLLLHGSKAARWPAAERREGEDILARRPELKTLVNAEQRFESLLENQPSPPAAPVGLAARIATAATPNARRRSSEPSSLREFIAGIFIDLHLPAPAIAMATLLLVGIIIGFSLPASTTTVTTEVQSAICLQAALDYQGEIL